MSDSDKVKVHKVVLLVVDHDDLGAKEVGDVLENNRYPNHCMSPDVLCVETREVVWTDEHPLNFDDERRVREFEQLFGQHGSVFDAQAAARNAAAIMETAQRYADERDIAKEGCEKTFRDLLVERAKVAALQSASLTITGLVHSAHAAAKAKGWHDNTNPADPYTLLAWMALAHSEISEAVEDIRKGKLTETFREGDGKPEGLPSELADVIIRIADTCGALGIDLEGAIRHKMAYNETRSHRHGGKVA